MLPSTLKLVSVLGAASATALSIDTSGYAAHQSPLSGGLSAAKPEKADFKCDLPPPVDPSHDGLSSAEELFSSDRALKLQIKRHQAIVRVPTVSYDDLGPPSEGDERWEPFYELHHVLEHLYPKLHHYAYLEKINKLGLVYTIQGSDDSLQPILLAAHQDVVPVADDSTWDYPPFEAHYDHDGWLWGRGSSDDKNSLTAVFSAVEALLSDKHWAPRRTIIIALGFDEECSGKLGAAAIGEHLTWRYGEDGIAVILDEGGLGIEVLDGGQTLYALPAVMEKGHLDIWFDLSVMGGHSSTPTPHTGIGIVSEIVQALEASPFAAAVIEDSPVHHQLLCQARYSPDAQPDITDLVRSGDLAALAAKMVAANPSAQYMIQTSQAVDWIVGGQKINALPELVRLGVNHRYAPQDSIGSVQHRAVEVISDIVAKYDLELRAFEGDEDYESFLAEFYPERLVRPAWDVTYNGTLVLYTTDKSYVTRKALTAGPVWDTFAGTIRHTFSSEDRLVVPVGTIMNGNTDTRHYLNLSPNIYRWSAVPKSGSRNIHTINERVYMPDHMQMLKFYFDFIRNFDQADF